MRYIWIFLLLLSCSKPFVTKFDVPKKAANLPYEEIKHPKNSLEWWYLTGFLEDNKGNLYGVEYVFFHFYQIDTRECHKKHMIQWIVKLPVQEVHLQLVCH